MRAVLSASYMFNKDCSRFEEATLKGICSAEWSQWSKGSLSWHRQFLRIEPEASRHERFIHWPSLPFTHGAVKSSFKHSSWSFYLVGLFLSPISLNSVSQELKRINVTGEKAHLAATQLSWKLLSKDDHVMLSRPITCTVITTAIKCDSIDKRRFVDVRCCKLHCEVTKLHKYCWLYLFFRKREII